MITMDVWIHQSLSTNEAGCGDLCVVLSVSSVVDMVS